MTMSKITFIVFLTLCLIDVTQCTGRARLLRRHRRYIEMGPDVMGPYCETRPNRCCPGRIDECSVPILDTLCYCDVFCNRSRSDCCPDYFSFCLGQRPSTPPTIRGKSVCMSECVALVTTRPIPYLHQTSSVLGKSPLELLSVIRSILLE